MKLQLKDGINNQFFIDVTCQIISVQYRPHKLMIIKSFNKITNNTKLCILIVIKYEDENSFY